MIVAFSVAPAGGESDSVSAAVAEAVRVVRDSGLPYELNAMFTLVEGEWDEVMEVVRRAVQAASAGATRTSLVLKADIRPGYTGQLRAKVDRVTQHLSD
ncbi:MAG: MTH1187 family thiamine-binding protein [Pseudonocardiaceae bacterium]